MLTDFKVPHKFIYLISYSSTFHMWEGNFQDREKMRVEKEIRLRYGRFFYRFPNGESAADVYDRITGTTKWEISILFHLVDKFWLVWQFYVYFQLCRPSLRCIASYLCSFLLQASGRHSGQILTLAGFSHLENEVQTLTWW